MIHYGLVIAATILFSLQFFFNQRFQRSYGADLKASLVFSLYKSIVIIVIMLIISGFKVELTWFSLLMAVLYAASGILMSYYSLKAFTVANLSVFSVFSMLGGMILPFFLGVIFYDEPLTVFKTICCALIVGAVLLNIRSGKQNKKALLYYFAVFFLNGMAGVISKIHQSSQYAHTDSTGFMILSSAVMTVICAVWLLVGYRSIPLVKGKDLLFVSGYGVFNGVGNLFLLIALSVLPASVQYPLVTGGVMVCSTVISTVRREKLTAKDYAATAIALLASIFIAI
ncbi:MAG: hypothetical protein IJY08_03290 [Clostridia bacterium]|nr:hypothetical protein [Clostridia bacterium]